MQPEGDGKRGCGRRGNGGGSCSLMIAENSPVMPPTQWTFGDVWVVFFSVDLDGWNLLIGKF
jgi:hypothetical protein